MYLPSIMKSSSVCCTQKYNKVRWVNVERCSVQLHDIEDERYSSQWRLQSEIQPPDKRNDNLQELSTEPSTIHNTHYRIQSSSVYSNRTGSHHLSRHLRKRSGSLFLVMRLARLMAVALASLSANWVWILWKMVMVAFSLRKCLRDCSDFMIVSCSRVEEGRD